MPWGFQMTEKETLNWMLERIKEAERLQPVFNWRIPAIGRKARLEIERLRIEDGKHVPRDQRAEKESRFRIQYRGNMISIEQECKLFGNKSDTVPSEVRLNSIHEQIVSAI